MNVFLETLEPWRLFLIGLLVFGIAPGACLRLVVLLYPKGHPRRSELIAELYAMSPYARPLWVAEQLETAVFQGLSLRWTLRRLGKIQSGVETAELFVDRAFDWLDQEIAELWRLNSQFGTKSWRTRRQFRKTLRWTGLAPCYQWFSRISRADVLPFELRAKMVALASYMNEREADLWEEVAATAHRLRMDRRTLLRARRRAKRATASRTTERFDSEG